MISDIIKENKQFSESIINSKYCIKEQNENNWNDVVSRFRDKMRGDVENGSIGEDVVSNIMEMIETKSFIPGGSILFGYGNESVKCSLSNCYVLKIKKDSIEAIYDFLKESARTFSWRGGVGTTISILRPAHTEVNNAAKTSSGAVSFCPLISENTGTIGQNNRRGASLIALHIWHPDIEDFIDCKSDPEKVFGINQLTGKVKDVFNANLSVLVTDKFMDAVKNDKDWDLVFPEIEADKDLYNDKWNGNIEDWEAEGGSVVIYKTVKARDLFRKIAEQAWASGDPGILYWDNIINNSTTAFDDYIKSDSTNPCAELPLSDGESCLLAASVLSKYVVNPWTDKAFFDFDLFTKDIGSILRFMDYIVDVNLHPLEIQNIKAKYGRRIGYEFTALADTLAMLGYKYGSPEAIKFLKEFMFKKLNAEINTQIDMAKEKGACPALETNEARQKYIMQPFLQNHCDELQLSEIIDYGVRNVSWSTIGPTGSVSIVADNCTSGVEPLFAMEYYRKTMFLDEEARIIHPPLLEHCHKHNIDVMSMSKEEILEKFNYIEAGNLDFKQRIDTQSILQDYITDSISSTVNLHNNATVEDIEEIYMYAHDNNLKGVTVFRDGCKDGVLSTKKKEDDKSEPIQEYQVAMEKDVLDEEDAKRYIVSWKGVKIYITITHDEDGMPIEMFANVPQEVGLNSDGFFNQELFMERWSYWHTISRLCSTILRFGIPVDELIKQLDKSSFNITHLPNLFSRLLKRYPIDGIEEDISDSSDENSIKYSICPKCKERTYENSGGCGQCINPECLFSNCS